MRSAFPRRQTGERRQRTTAMKVVGVVGLAGATALALFLTQFLTPGSGPVGRANAAASSNLTLTADLTGQSAATSASARASSSAAVPGANYGRAVVVSGTTAVVGSPEADAGQGVAYIYNRSQAGRWQLTQQLNNPNPDHFGDFFGYSVAIFGSTIAVGAPEQYNRRGAVYLFDKSGSAWGYSKELFYPNATGVEQNFGASVAITNDQLVVGAPGQDNNQGYIYIYTRFPSGWYLDAPKTLPTPHGLPVKVDWGDNFGFSVAIVGGTILASAPGRNHESGVVAVFGEQAASPTNWSLIQTISDPNPIHPNDSFGFSVSLGATYAIIGAPGRSNSRGVAYIYSRSGASSWNLATKLEDPSKTAVEGDNFGSAVSITNGTALIGSSFTGNSMGVVYEAKYRSNGTWPLTRQVFTDPGRTAEDAFGSSVSVSGGIAVIGAVGTNNGTGAAYIYSQATLATSKK